MSGDAAAFAVLVEGTSARLVRLSARLLGGVAEAEDVVQDAYVRAFEALSKGRFDRRARVRTWLTRIVVNGSIDALRSRRRRPAPTDSLEGGAWVSPESAEQRLALSELSGLLEALPADQRAALVLTCVEGYSATEAAELLGCTVGAVEQRLVRARATLRAGRREG